VYLDLEAELLPTAADTRLRPLVNEPSLTRAQRAADGRSTPSHNGCL